jgi:Killing trait
MAEVTTVNSQITDAVTQANVKVLADAPAQALGSLYQVNAHAIGLSMQNAVANQQNMNTIDTSVTTQGVNLIYSIPVAAGARGTNEIFSGNSLAETLTDLKTTLQSLKRPAPAANATYGAGGPTARGL